MRTPPGKAHTTKLMNQELVRTKGDDGIYMAAQRAKLDEEERVRRLNLVNQQTDAIRQQRTIMAFALFGGAVMCAIAFALLFVR